MTEPSLEKVSVFTLPAGPGSFGQSGTSSKDSQFGNSLVGFFSGGIKPEGDFQVSQTRGESTSVMSLVVSGIPRAPSFAGQLSAMNNLQEYASKNSIGFPPGKSASSCSSTGASAEIRTSLKLG